MKDRRTAYTERREREIRRLVERLTGDKARLRELVTFLLEVTAATIDAGAGTEEEVPAFIRRQCERVKTLELELAAVSRELDAATRALRGDSSARPVVAAGVEGATSGVTAGGD